MNLEAIKAKYSEEDILRIKKNSRQITACAGDSLEKIVLQLENLRRQGKLNCFVNFNGIKLYSIDVTMNSAFKECVGCTRKTWLKKQKKWLEDAKTKTEKWKKEAEEKLPYWIEEGKKYIHPAKFENWKKTCIASANGDYYGLEVRDALEIMKMIEDGVSFEDIKEKIEKAGHSGMTYSGTMNVVLNYARKGPEFYSFMNSGHMSIYDEKYVSKIKELNERILSGESLEDVYENLKDYRIMEISIISDSGNGIKMLNGTILVNKDGTFEGLVDNNNYIYGKLLGDKGIVFASFCNYGKASNYCGINENGVYMGKHEIYSFDGNIDNGIVIMVLEDSSKKFASEIGIEYQIDKIKGYFNEYVKEIYAWYSNNMNSEVERILLSLTDGLNERLINALKIRLSMLTVEQQLDVLALPNSRAFVIAPDKREEFLNHPIDLESVKEIVEMAETFRNNNLGGALVLRKTKTSEKK